MFAFFHLSRRGGAGGPPGSGGTFHQNREFHKDGSSRRNRGDDDRNSGDRNMGRIDEDNAEENFQLVDTSKTATVKRFVTPAARRRQHSARLRQVNARRQQSATSNLSKETLQSSRGGRGGGGR